MSHQKSHTGCWGAMVRLYAIANDTAAAIQFAPDLVPCLVFANLMLRWNAVAPTDEAFGWISPCCCNDACQGRVACFCIFFEIASIFSQALPKQAHANLFLPCLIERDVCGRQIEFAIAWRALLPTIFVLRPSPGLLILEARSVIPPALASVPLVVPVFTTLSLPRLNRYR